MKADEAKRLVELERENSRAKLGGRLRTLARDAVTALQRRRIRTDRRARLTALRPNHVWAIFSSTRPPTNDA